MFYIQCRSKQGLETVGEYSRLWEARRDLVEYRKSDWMNEYRISTRPCNDWKDKDV